MNRQPKMSFSPRFNHSSLVSSLLAATLLALAPMAFAEVDEVVKKARALIEGGQAKQAFDLLEPLELARAGDADFDTTLGIAANETNQFTRAVFALERALAVQPDNARARAELGRSLFAVGDTQGARKLLLETQKGNLPAEASATIDQFLQAIDRAEDAGRSSVRGYVEATIGYDTNINSGPGNANVAVPAFGGLVFTLNQAGLATKDTFVSVGGGLSGRYVVDSRLSLIGSLSGLAKDHFKTDNTNSTQVDASAGATYRYEKHEFSGVVQIGSNSLDDTDIRHQAGLIGEWTYRLDGFRQISSYLQWAKLRYPEQKLRNAERLVLGSTYAHTFANGLLTYGGGYFGTERPDDDRLGQLGHKLFGLRAGVQYGLSPSTALFATLAYENRKYGAVDPFFLVTRKDDQLNLNLGLNWIPAKNWKVTPQLQLTKVKSNIVISDFNRAAASVNVRRDF